MRTCRVFSVFNGVRPSSDAETLENDTVFRVSDALGDAEVDAPGDGRTSVNRYVFWRDPWPAKMPKQANSPAWKAIDRLRSGLECADKTVPRSNLDSGLGHFPSGFDSDAISP